jgi:hypothetical protein
MQGPRGKLALVPDELHVVVLCVEHVDLGDELREEVLVG